MRKLKANKHVLTFEQKTLGVNKNIVRDNGCSSYLFLRYEKVFFIKVSSTKFDMHLILR